MYWLHNPSHAKNAFQVKQSFAYLVWIQACYLLNLSSQINMNSIPFHLTIKCHRQIYVVSFGGMNLFDMN